MLIAVRKWVTNSVLVLGLGESMIGINWHCFSPSVSRVVHLIVRD
jgi:hypothetical protein